MAGFLLFKGIIPLIYFAVDVQVGTEVALTAVIPIDGEPVLGWTIVEYSCRNA